MPKHTLVLYSPHDLQLKFHQSKARFRVVSTGRQFGKSTMASNELGSKSWINPGTKYWFISPIYSQAKDQFKKMIDMLPQEVIKRTSETELSIELINGSVIEYKSGETLHRLRGATLHGVVIDEVRDQHPDLWPLVIRPMLTTTNGFAIFVSTPSGFDSFYDLAMAAQSDTSGHWEFFKGASICNPLFTQEEYENAKREMSPLVFEQEILAEFRNLTAGQAYLSFGTHNIKASSPFTFDGSIISPHLPITVGLDFNVNPMAWCLGQFRNHASYWFDEIFVQNTNTQECANILADRVIKHQPGVILCGDATGNSRNTKATESDYAIILNTLRARGIKVDNRTPTVNPPVKERVNTVNARLKAADGSISTWIHPQCKQLIKDLERVVWKDGQSSILDQTTDKERTHMSDAFGYPIHAFSNITEVGGVGSLRVLVR